MASNQTSSYGLSQWEAADAVQRLEFNADNAKVDAALKSLSDQVVQKANQSALNTVISAVNQKADASTVSSLSQTVAGHTTAITKLGNCTIEHFTYVGNGANGNNNPRSITFPRPPLLFFIRSEDGIGMGSRLHTGMTAAFQGSGSGAVSSLPLTWSGNTARLISWSDALDFNRNGDTYHVFAFYAEDE